MDREVRIGQADAFLALSEPEGLPRWRDRSGKLEAFEAVLVLPRLRAESRVYLTDSALESSLADFLSGLAQDWRGWEGARDWAAHEGALTLSCTHDGLGHVGVSVELSDHSRRQWTVAGTVPVDAGQLDEIKRGVQAFLG